MMFSATVESRREFEVLVHHPTPAEIASRGLAKETGRPSKLSTPPDLGNMP